MLQTNFFTNANGTDILFLLAHPDDAEIWCGGTIAKLAKQGHRSRVIIAMSTAERRSEAERSASLVNGLTLEFLDGIIFNDFCTLENAQTVARIIDTNETGIIITHNPNDMNLDHRRCFKLLQMSLFHTRKDLCMPIVYACNSYLGINGDGTLFQPTLFVDISDTALEKEKLIRCHQSQRCDVYVDMCERMDAFYGLISGTQRAEVYRHIILNRPGFSGGFSI